MNCRRFITVTCSQTRNTDNLKRYHDVSTKWIEWNLKNKSHFTITTSNGENRLIDKNHKMQNYFKRRDLIRLFSVNFRNRISIRCSDSLLPIFRALVSRTTDESLWHHTSALVTKNIQQKWLNYTFSASPNEGRTGQLAIDDLTMVRMPSTEVFKVFIWNSRRSTHSIPSLVFISHCLLQYCARRGQSTHSIYLNMSAGY